ncbi:MAG: hypothetical protein KAT48_05245 [Bacteroidales bacterium]|nr:hypothetical protein [Bacteroidales bacterium]
MKHKISHLIRGKIILLIFLVIIFPLSIFAQGDTVYQKKTFLQRLDSIRTWKLERGRSTFMPFLSPSYTPEMQLTLTAGGLFTFKLNKESEILSRSSMPFSIGYSTNGSLLVSVKANIYGKDDKLRISGEYWIKDMPDNYWGVGYINAIERPESPYTTGYHRYWRQFKFKVSYRVFPNFYLGVNYDRNQTTASEVNEVMAVDEYYVEFGPEIKNSGFGMVYRYDSRDFPENAYKGILVELSGTAYGKHSSSNNVFRAAELDYRQYQQIARKGSTLAWQLKTRVSTGDVPWTEMSMVGTPFDLRGYTWGHFRDYNMLFFLSEYRYMFGRKTPRSNGEMYGPFGFVVWAGTGSVAPKLNQMKNWLPNAGVGLRFELQERMNIRIDYGVGKESSAFYFSFNEAF